MDTSTQQTIQCMPTSNGLRVWAKTDISKGEEVYVTYDECVDCGPLLKLYWGTPEILREFGFVEQYKQRWVYKHEGIWFEITDEDGELEVVWDISDGVYRTPDEKGLAFLQAELERLQKLDEEELKDRPQVPEHEWSVILQFHQASIKALSMAIESAETFNAKQDMQEL